MSTKVLRKGGLMDWMEVSNPPTSPLELLPMCMETGYFCPLCFCR
jgi:hypothetical protein